MAAAIAYRPDQDPFFRNMIALREAPMRLLMALGRNAVPRAAFGLDDFTRAAQSETEIVYGLIGQFWKPGYGLVAVPDGTAFKTYGEPGVAKLAFNFLVTQRAGGEVILSTETRVFCPDEAARKRFTPYWYLVRPVSGLIRRRMLTRIKRASLAA
ncbi:hypothetical protein RAS12_00715 [Achromobacter seleniivolatilans]|uniref:DUF2867 domain-containing protein n=1 Tax=Achromobacter seleniivolatilans TaxID=3047478 RepID=A0ABY9M1Q6_9BURK|nr:hypothetical protein [Achromobacter sp. R39]WMD20926.1 hypothetical protein RAS12_00715 [Achromobacter sp. R39]